jgi:hypothetical protein
MWQSLQTVGMLEFISRTIKRNETGWKQRGDRDLLWSGINRYDVKQISEDGYKFT